MVISNTENLEATVFYTRNCDKMWEILHLFGMLQELKGNRGKIKREEHGKLGT